MSTLLVDQSTSINVTSVLVPGDQVTISAATAKYLQADSSGQLLATASEDNATKFQVEVVGAQICLKSSGGYVGLSPDNLLRASSASSTGALHLDLLSAQTGAVVIVADGDARWVLKDDGTVTTDPQASGLVTEFDIHVVNPSSQPAVAGIDVQALPKPTPCEEAMAVLVYQVTIGLFLAMGLGPGFGTGKTAPGLLALLRSNTTVWGAVENIIATCTEAALENPRATLNAVFALLVALNAAGLLWTVMRFALSSLGWYIAFRIVAKILELVLAPEAEAVDLLASFAIWSAQTIKEGIDVGAKCQTVRG